MNINRRTFLSGITIPAFLPIANLFNREYKPLTDISTEIKRTRPLSLYEQLNDDVLFKKELALHLENKLSHRYGISEKILEASENDIITRDIFHRNNIQVVIPSVYFDDFDGIRDIFYKWSQGIKYHLKQWPEYNWKYRVRSIKRYPSKKELSFKVKIVYFGFNKHRTVV